MSSLSVRDLMTENVVSMTPDDSVTALFDVMMTRNIRHVPIVDDDGAVLGLVSHRDLVRSVVPEDEDLPMANWRDMLDQLSIGDIMVEGIETISPDQDIITAAQIMLDNKFGCLPVTEGNHLVGIVTEADFVRYVVDQAVGGVP